MALCDNKLTLRKTHSLVIEKYVEDVELDEKQTRIIKPILVVKQESQLVLVKTNLFGSKINKKIKALSF